MDINELESFKLSDAVAFHKELNPKLWEDEKLDPTVREQLLLIAEDFVEYLGISNLNVRDVTISGSNAAYSYTPHSDIDLHVLVDFNELPNNEVYQELFTAKKTLYNDAHDITVRDVPVELYVQDTNNPVQSLGEYSIVHDKWIRIPKKRRANFDQAATRLKYEKLGELIELALKTKDAKRVNDTIALVKRYRKSGLDKAGEFGPENLAYKAVRKQGLVQALHDLKAQLHTEKLSIDEYANEDYDPNGPPPGPEFKPTMPAGTVKVDVSDVYDWYKLGQHISNLKGLGKHDFGQGPPSTILSFGDEDTEHKYIQDLEKTGLTTTDIDPVDPNQPKGMKRQKTDPTYNVNEAEPAKPTTSINFRTWQRGGVPKHSFVVTRNGKEIAYGEVAKDNEWDDDRGASVQEIVVDSAYRRKGIATKIYNEIERRFNYKLHPSDDVKPDGQAFWKARGNLDEATDPTYNVNETDDRKAAVLKIQKHLNKKYGANLDLDGKLGPLTLKSINKFMPRAKTGLADEPNKTTAVQGKKLKEAKIDAHRQGDTIWINYFEVPEKGKGLGTQEYMKFEKSLPKDIKKIRLVASDAGYGPTHEFWDRMGFDYAYPDDDNEMVKLLEASGYIPSAKEKNDPRFKTALTKDVTPNSNKDNAKAFGWKVSRAGIPPQARADGKIAEDLMREWKSFLAEDEQLDELFGKDKKKEPFQPQQIRQTYDDPEQPWATGGNYYGNKKGLDFKKMPPAAQRYMGGSRQINRHLINTTSITGNLKNILRRISFFGGYTNKITKPIKELDDLLANSFIPNDMVAYHGTKSFNPGEVASQNNGLLRIPTYLSVSPNKNVAYEFAKRDLGVNGNPVDSYQILEIQLKKGQTGYVAPGGVQEEIVLPRNTVFKIDPDPTKIPNGYIWHATIQSPAVTEQQEEMFPGYDEQHREKRLGNWLAKSWGVQNGKPQTFYHATTKDFDTFNTHGTGFASALGMAYEVERHGSFFAVDPKFAEGFIEDPNTGRVKEGGRILPVHLSIQSPIDLRDDALSRMLSDPETRAEFKANDIDLNSIYNHFYELERWELFDGPEGAEFIDNLQKLGFDGAIINEAIPNNSNAKSGQVWVAFNPNQVKSVYNRGSFSPDDARLMREDQKNTVPKIGYHVTATKNLPIIQKNGIKADKRGSSYIWDSREMAEWFMDFQNDEGQDRTILKIDMAGLDANPDPEAEDMSEWSSRFKPGTNGGAWIISGPIPSDKIIG